MWFKNLQIYRLPAPWAFTAEQMEEALQSQAFTPASSNELLRQGWDSPRGNGKLVHEVNKQMLMMLGTEKKLLPGSVVNQVAKARAAELEEQQGFPPGKKAMKELKERVADELLPRAFSIRSNVWTWIDPVNGWLVIDAASPSKADAVIKLLLKAVDRMPLESLRVQSSPVGMMTAWLAADEAPYNFTIDQDAELRATGESRSSVRWVKHVLGGDDVCGHIAAGKQCVRLAMTWNSRISFMLTESLAIKGVKPLDVIKENEAVTYSDDERFDNDIMLMTGELSKMMGDLVEALDGEAHDLVSKAQEDAGERPPIARVIASPHEAAFGLPDLLYGLDDPLYAQAATIVRTHQRGSISLIQRHLCVGYNRAARLMDALEMGGVVGAMQSNGHRDVLPENGATA